MAREAAAEAGTAVRGIRKTASKERGNIWDVYNREEMREEEVARREEGRLWCKWRIEAGDFSSQAWLSFPKHQLRF